MRVNLRHSGHRAVRAHDGLRVGTPTAAPRTPRSCTGCGCKLSVYRPTGDTTCSPCQGGAKA
jgi:hypothetical protein